MYLIKTYLAPSPIHGLGVFAGEDVPKGTLVWMMAEDFDRVFTPAQFAAFPAAIQAHIVHHCFMKDGDYYLCSDHGQYTNHSSDPNTVHNNNDYSDVAVRDIRKGEEITCDYHRFDEMADAKLK